MDTDAAERENPSVLGAGASRKRIVRTLNAAYAAGLLSEETFAHRLDEILASPLIDPRRLIGDLNLRASRGGRRTRVATAVREATRWARATPGSAEELDGESTLLALDWTGAQTELVLGRSRSCDVTVAHPSVSRRHARLLFRDGVWVLQDLDSTNGTRLNGVWVGRCILRPGDRLALGSERLQVD